MSKRRVLVAVTGIFVAAVLAVGCGGGGGSAQTKKVSVGTGKSVTVTMVARGVPVGVESNMRVGDTVRVADSGATVGDITAVETTDSPTAFGTADGALSVQRNPLARDVRMTVSGKADELEDGFRFSGNYLYGGTETNFTTRLAAFKAVILSIEAKD